MIPIVKGEGSDDPLAVLSEKLLKLCAILKAALQISIQYEADGFYHCPPINNISNRIRFELRTYSNSHVQ